MFSDTPWRDEAVDRLNEVIFRDGLYRSSQKDRAVVVVHPGFHLKFGGSVPSHDMFDYANYQRDLLSDLNGLGETAEAYILYPSGSRDHAADFLRSVSDEVFNDFNWVSSTINTGLPLSDGIEEYAEIFEGLDDGGEVVLMGEYNGLCFDEVKTLVSRLEKDYPYDLDVLEGARFCSKKLSREAGSLHLEGFQGEAETGVPGKKYKV